MAMSRCPNGNHKGPIQDFTETCMSCWRNIYETDAEYERYLDKELASRRIKDKERLLNNS